MDVSRYCRVATFNCNAKDSLLLFEVPKNSVVRLCSASAESSIANSSNRFLWRSRTCLHAADLVFEKLVDESAKMPWYPAINLAIGRY